MKKLIAAIFAAVLMSAGLVSFTGAPATAACPYTGCVKTNAQVTAPRVIKRGDRPKIRVVVRTKGNANARGIVRITIKRNGGGFTQIRNKAYNGTPRTVLGPNLRKPGRYTITIRFIPRPNSAFKGSVDTRTLTVRRR